MTGSFDLPDENEFDHDMQLILTRKQTKDVKAKPKKFYTLNFRVVRFAISEDSYESIITNLPKEDFPVEEIKKVYAMRWGIETSFRELKYAIGLCCFHSKKVEYIINLGR